MRMMYRCCSALDVHKKTVECCVRRLHHGKLHEIVRHFGTMTDDLLELVALLKAQDVTHVAMESTGVFWKPIYNVLEQYGFKVILVNPQHVKQVPGRKTDVRDCQWLCELLQYGLLKASFIPPQWQRDLRDLTRERKQLTDEQTRVANRIHKILEDANIKLGSVATDILGKSGRGMLEAIVAGEEDTEKLAEMARGKLRTKIPELRRSLKGLLRQHHRLQLKLHLDHLCQLEGLIGRLSERIAELCQPHEEKIERMDEVIGINRQGAEEVIAEIGVDMTVFPTEQHCCSWAAICSGNHESAGKRRSGRTRKGNRWLRQTLVLAARAASHAKDSYLASRYRRLSGRRGANRAAVAVAHTILRIIYHMLRDGTRYKDLGGNYFDRLDPQRLQRYLIGRLQRLGYKVTVEPLPAAA